MHITIFGLSISSSWGNRHASVWRSLCPALVQHGHRISFFEKDVPYYRQHRDLQVMNGVDIFFYNTWSEISRIAARTLKFSDLGIVTSYCPDAISASELLLDSNASVKAFYDLDTQVTLTQLEKQEPVFYIPANGLKDFDLVLSFTGGKALAELQQKLGAKRVAPLYGSVDPKQHFRRLETRFHGDLSYIGTYAADRQAQLERLFFEPARRLAEKRFSLAGSQYPEGTCWPSNIRYFEHLSPSEHPAFYGSSRLTLNITHQSMAEFGFCPSGRLFEAAACGTPVLSDYWQGMESFFTPGEEILIARNTDEALAALSITDRELIKFAKAARDRTLAENTGNRRAQDLEAILSELSIQSESIPSPRLELLPSPRSGMRWGIIPAAGAGTRIQPLAFSKELLPVGSHIDAGVERPRAVSEFLLERMVASGADRLCLVLSPGKSDILEYYSDGFGSVPVFYVVQPKPMGLCDALFRGLPLVQDDDLVMIGLPDTIWFPEDGFSSLDTHQLSFLLFHVDRPELFDSVTMEGNEIEQVHVKQDDTKTNWIWGAFQMPGHVYRELYSLWQRRSREDIYFGTLVNAYLAEGGRASGIKAGQIYVDVGTLHGYREATRVLSSQSQQGAIAS